jgi:hypothetical protein
MWPICGQGGNGLTMLQPHALKHLNDLTDLAPHFAVGDVQVGQHKGVTIATALNGGDDEIAHAATMMNL